MCPFRGQHEIDGLIQTGKFLQKNDKNLPRSRTLIVPNVVGGAEVSGMIGILLERSGRRAKAKNTNSSTKETIRIINMTDLGLVIE